MKLENQVCTLEQAKRLKELGVVVRSIFFWHNEHPLPRGGYESTPIYKVYSEYKSSAGDKNIYNAYTVSELGVMLPNITKCADELQEYLENVFSGDASNSDNEELFWRSLFNADFLAGCLIYLLTFNHITADEVNERLKS